MTRYKITIETAYMQGTGWSKMTRNLEAADLECAMKQAKKDLESAEKIFPNSTWHLDNITEVEAATK
jgi:thioesterase domain-containing protein